MRTTLFLALVLLVIPAHALAGYNPVVNGPEQPALAVGGAQSGGIVPAVVSSGGSANGAEILLAKNGRHRGYYRHHGFRGRHYGHNHFRRHNRFSFGFFTPFYGSYGYPYYRSYYGYPYYSSNCYGYSPYYGYYRYPYRYGYCY